MKKISFVDLPLDWTQLDLVMDQVSPQHKEIIRSQHVKTFLFLNFPHFAQFYFNLLDEYSKLLNT